MVSSGTIIDFRSTWPPIPGTFWQKRQVRLERSAQVTTLTDIRRRTLAALLPPPRAKCLTSETRRTNRPPPSCGCTRSSTVIARKQEARVWLYSRPGNDLTGRFPLIVETLAGLRSRSCIIDGEAVACDDSGIAQFNRSLSQLRRKERRKRKNRRKRY